MSKPEIHDVNAVRVRKEDDKHIVTLGSGTKKTDRYRFDKAQFLLLIVEFAQSEGIQLPTLDDLALPEAKPWTPWVVKTEEPFE